jgi:hypothetical protein
MKKMILLLIFGIFIPAVASAHLGADHPLTWVAFVVQMSFVIGCLIQIWHKNRKKKK